MRRDLEQAAELGRTIGEAILGSRLTLHHDVKHLIEYAPRPVPVQVYAEINNHAGEIWRAPGYTLSREQPYMSIDGVAIAWITGNQEDAGLGNTRIRLRFEYR